MNFLSQPDWISDDAINLRAFLETGTGRKLLQMLAHSRPTFFDDTVEAHASMARSRSIAGYELALSELISLSAPDHHAPPPPPVSSGMPDLEDDTQWPEPTKV